jgi:Ca-activated chloride channel family protein
MLYLFAISSGLAGFAADAKEFLAALRFARPVMLWLLVLLPLLGVLNYRANRRRRLTIAQIGRPGAVAGQLTQPVRRRRWLGIAYPIAWILLVLGVAGPRWGKSDETGVAVGRDVVIVIDLSRSMQADDMADRTAPTRWEAARNAALNLVDGISHRGGHRVGVVVFAARAKLLCPLTTDYDHVRAIIEDIDGLYPPPEIRPPKVRAENEPEIISGTRIGSGLIAAVLAHDKRFPGYQDIFLISDGDDPADDKEWVKGSDKARDSGIPIFTVGVGNPDMATPVLLKSTQGEELVNTQLQEDPLKQIAAETRGQYIAARTTSPQLGEFFHAHLEPMPSREVSDESLPLPAERYLFFLGPALLLFSIGWLRGR